MALPLEARPIASGRTHLPAHLRDVLAAVRISALRDLRLAASRGTEANGRMSAAPDTFTEEGASVLVLTAAERARILREATKDKSYQETPLGHEVGLFLRAMRFKSDAPNTLDSYETTLSRFARDHADFSGLARFAAPDGAELIEDFLARHWADAAAATRANRLAAVKSFFAWGVGRGLISWSPAAGIQGPRVRNRQRHAHGMAMLKQLVYEQPQLRDRIGLQLLSRLGLRKNELRLIRLADFNLPTSEVLVHGKGGKDAVLPYGVLAGLRDEIYLEVAAGHRAPEEYLLYPRAHPLRPMDQATIHRWFKRCLERAGLPSMIEMHELRHSAADTLWRATGDVVKAQSLLRHESLDTTRRYLHPTSDDLSAGLSVVGDLWNIDQDEPSRA
jgi:site-specific recombinase XerD